MANPSANRVVVLARRYNPAFVAMKTSMNLMDETRSPRRWHHPTIALLMLAQIACAVLASSASSDTNRDIFFAQQIASGSFFPLTGPALNASLHEGPLWYYLLAPVFQLLPNAAAVAGFIVAIGTLQFPLAYRLGLRYASPREGMLFVFALALPGFMDTELGWLTHTAAIIPSAMLGVLAADAYRARRDAVRAVLLGLVFVLMLTAHPTLALIGVLLALWSGLQAPNWRTGLFHAAIALAPLLLAVAPMLFDESRRGFADATTAQRYVDNEWSLPSLRAGSHLIYAVFANGPKYVSRFWLELPAPAMRPLIALYALVIVAAATGLAARLLREPAQRPLITVLIALTLLQAIFLCAIRLVQPPWMIFALWTVLAALIALGLEQVCRIGAAARRGVALALVITTVWSLAVWIRFASGPLAMIDIKRSEGRHGSYDVRDYEKGKNLILMTRIPYRQYLAIAGPLCHPVSLYAHYAHFVDITYAVGAAYLCGGTGNVQFGGPLTPEREALLGLHEAVWQRLELVPPRRIGVLGIATPDAIWQSPQPTRPVLPLLTNYPRVLSDPVERFRVSGDAPGNQVIVVAHRALRYGKFAVVAASVDGTAVEPIWSDFATAVYYSPSTAVRHWEIDIEAMRNYVDVLTFSGSAVQHATF